MTINIIIYYTKNLGINVPQKLFSKYNYSFYDTIFIVSDIFYEHVCYEQKNYIISDDRNIQKRPIDKVFASLDEALLNCDEHNQIFILGHSELYKEAIKNKIIDKIYITHFDMYDDKCDDFLPNYFEIENLKKKI